MGDVFSASIAGIILGLVIFYGGFQSLRLKRLIENTPTSKIRSLAMGLVEIYGEALPLTKPLKSPLSKIDCVYYTASIEERRGSGKSARWVTVFLEQSKNNFYIKDETGKVLINPLLAQLELAPDKVISSGFGVDPPKDMIKFLEEHKIKYEGWFGANKSMKFNETIIAVKDKIYVMGTATTNTEAVATSKGYEKIIITKGDKKGIFYISDKSEKEVLSKFKWKIIFGIYGGAALTLICTLIILSVIGLW